MRIKWLEKAFSELAEITEYIAKDDEDAAKKVATYIQLRVESLVHLPNQGRQGRVTGTRELVIDKFPSFLIPYRVRGEEIQILRVFHTSQNPPKKW